MSSEAQWLLTLHDGCAPDAMCSACIANQEEMERLADLIRRQDHDDRRDRFVAAALTGLLSNKDLNANGEEWCAEVAANHADATIAELEKGKA